MDAIHSATLSPIAASPFRVVISRNQENVACCCLQFLESGLRRPVLARSLKLSVTEHFGEPKKILDNLAVTMQTTSPKPLQEFSWEKAKSMALQRFLFLGKNAFKFSFITWFIITFVIDVFIAVSSNRELLIPLGLFIGVTLANFLKETTQEFFQSSMQDTSFIKNLLCIGSLFVLLKLISSGLNMQGLTLLFHIGNGGLMQVLWLAKELQQTQSIGNQEKCTSTTDSTSSTVEV